MTVVTAWKRTDTFGNSSKIVFMKMTYESGDTSVAVDTGLHKIFSFEPSPTSVTGKKINYATVDAGTITFTVADPLTACEFYVTARGN